MPLTDPAARKAQPGEKPYKLADEKGLFLLAGTKPGALYWRFKYRFAGKGKLLVLGVYPESSLKRARQNSGRGFDSPKPQGGPTGSLPVRGTGDTCNQNPVLYG